MTQTQTRRPSYFPLPDWRQMATLAVRSSFPGLSDGHIRRPLVVAIARGRDPDHAADLVSAEADKLGLTVTQQHDVTLIVASLRNRGLMEAP